jgi:hypothetical protein
MPTLQPHIGGQSYRTTQRPANTDISGATRGLISTVKGVLDHRQKVALAEQKADLDSATIRGNNNLRLFQEEFSINPRGMTDQEYTEGQDEALNDAFGETNPALRGAFDQSMSTNKNIHGINARATRISAISVEGKANTDTKYSDWEKNSMRNYAELAQIGLGAIGAGFYSPDYIKERTGKAIMAASLNDAVSNPQGTLDAIEANDERYNSLSDVNKKKVKSAALSTIKQNKELLELRMGETAVTVLKQVDLGGIPSDFYGNIDELVDTGILKKAEGEAMSLAYQRGRGINQKTSDETFTKLSLENAIVDKRTEDKYMEDSLTYSKQVRDLYKNIYTAYGEKKLTFPHFQKLLDDAGKSTALKSQLVKKQLLDPEQSEKGYVANQAAFDSFMLYTGGDIARSNNLMTRYISDKSEIPDDKMTTLLPTIIYEDKKGRGEKATTLAIRLLTTKEKGKSAESDITAYQRKNIVQEKEKTISGITYTKVEGGWKRK